MAVTFDAVGPSSAGATASGVATVSWSHTCSGTQGLLIVAAALGSFGDASWVTTATYNSVSMTSAGVVHANGSNQGYVQLWYLVGPATGANTVLVTNTNNLTVDAFSAGSISLNGVNQTTPIGTPGTASGSGTAPSVVLGSTTSGNMVVDAVCCGGGVTSSNQTQRWLRNSNTNTAAGNGAGSTAAAGGSVTMSYAITNDWWGIIAVEALAAGGAASAPVYVPTVAPSLAAISRSSTW